MKKLVIICMLAAIGAVGMIDRSNAENRPQGCGTGNFGCFANPQTTGRTKGMGDLDRAPNHGNWQKNVNPNWQMGQSNWQNRRHHNWQQQGNWNNRNHRYWNNGIQPFIGLQFGSQYDDGYYPGYYDDGPNYYDAPPVYRYSSASRCDALANRLRGIGYRNVRATDCAGTSFVFRATKAGRAVKVTVSARSGSVIRVASAY